MYISAYQTLYDKYICDLGHVISTRIVKLPILLSKYQNLDEYLIICFGLTFNTLLSELIRLECSVIEKPKLNILQEFHSKYVNRTIILAPFR